MIPAFERAKTVPALDGAVAVIGPAYSSRLNINAIKEGEMKGAFSTYNTCVGPHHGKSPLGGD
jgi:hypothetical protein